MKTPTEWETWCDEMWFREKRYPFWHELIEAIQADAIASAAESAPATDEPMGRKG